MTYVEVGKCAHMGKVSELDIEQVLHGDQHRCVRKSRKNVVSNDGYSGNEIRLHA